MRVLVCGSRTFGDGGLLRQVLDGLYYRRDEIHKPWQVIYGGAQGADKLAADWAKANGLRLSCFPADWARNGKAAGPIRNREMLEHGRPDLVVAFIDKPLEDSKGTYDMVKLARIAGVRTVVVECWPPAADQTRLAL